MKGIVAKAVMVIAWVVIIAGAFLFVDGFLPSRSQGPAISGVEVAMGAAGCTIGLGLRWVSKAINGHTGGHKESETVSEQKNA